MGWKRFMPKQRIGIVAVKFSSLSDFYGSNFITLLTSLLKLSDHKSRLLKKPRSS